MFNSSLTESISMVECVLDNGGRLEYRLSEEEFQLAPLTMVSVRRVMDG